MNFFQKTFSFNTETLFMPQAITVFNSSREEIEKMHNAKIDVVSIRPDINNNIIVKYKLLKEQTND